MLYDNDFNMQVSSHQIHKNTLNLIDYINTLKLYKIQILLSLREELEERLILINQF